MATIIKVENKKFVMPTTPFIIQTDTGVNEYEFQVTENNVDLTDFSFYLSYRNNQNQSDKTALTKLGTLESGAIRLQWIPDDAFTAVKGKADIQILACDSTDPTVIWHSLPVRVFLYEDVMHCI